MTFYVNLDDVSRVFEEESIQCPNHDFDLTICSWIISQMRSVSLSFYGKLLDSWVVTNCTLLYNNIAKTLCISLQKRDSVVARFNRNDPPPLSG